MTTSLMTINKMKYFKFLVKANGIHTRCLFVFNISKTDSIFIVSQSREDDDINDIRVQRNNLCHLLDVTVPVMKVRLITYVVLLQIRLHYYTFVVIQEAARGSGNENEASF